MEERWFKCVESKNAHNGIGRSYSPGDIVELEELKSNMGNSSIIKYFRELPEEVDKKVDKKVDKGLTKTIHIINWTYKGKRKYYKK